MNRFFLVLLVLFACTTPTPVRKVSRLYGAQYFPPNTMFLWVGEGLIPLDDPEQYILWFDVGEKEGVPAYVSRSIYVSAQIGASYDITYSNGEGCTNTRHVTQFN